jgi:DNA topoisomerase-1
LHEEPGLSLRALLDEVSQRLGNTPAIARKSYVHPAVIAAAKGDAGAVSLPETLPRGTQWMTREERGLLKFLEVV